MATPTHQLRFVSGLVSRPQVLSTPAVSIRNGGAAFVGASPRPSTSSPRFRIQRAPSMPCGGAANPTVWHNGLRDDLHRGALALAEPLKGHQLHSRRRRGQPERRPSSAPFQPPLSPRAARPPTMVLRPASDQPVGLLCRCHASALSAASASPGVVAAAQQLSARGGSDDPMGKQSTRWRADGRLSPTARAAAQRRARQTSAAMLSAAQLYGQFASSVAFFPGPQEPARTIEERMMQRRREMREHERVTTLATARERRAADSTTVVLAGRHASKKHSEALHDFVSNVSRSPRRETADAT